jgi:hypothetical protein
MSSSRRFYHLLPFVASLGALPCLACDARVEGPLQTDGASADLEPPAVDDGTFAHAVLELEPVAYYRLGDVATGTVHDASGHGHDGVYVGSPELTFGALVRDDDGALGVQQGQAQYAQIPDHDDFSLTKAQDGFARSLAQGSSFGMLEHGGSWSSEFFHGSSYSCDGQRALIHPSSAASTFGQTLALARKDVDVQVKVAWDEAAVGGPLRPLAVLARLDDAGTFYAAELREQVGGQLELWLRRSVNGVSTDLTVLRGLGSYHVGEEWFVRLQLEGSTLRARAWPAGSAQPSAWLTASDTAIAGSGRVGIRSSYRGSRARPTVYLDDFRVQSVGMTVHAFVRADQLAFESSNGYLHWLGKGEAGEQEWAFRLYTRSDATRPSRLSAYHWNLAGKEGAGAYYQNGQEPPEAGHYVQLVAEFDAGDALDSSAGVALFVDGELVKAPPSPGTLYANPGYLVMPENGSAPLRLGTRSLSPLGLFGGAIDEVALFDRKLSHGDIEALAAAAR